MATGQPALCRLRMVTMNGANMDIFRAREQAGTGRAHPFTPRGMAVAASKTSRNLRHCHGKVIFTLPGEVTWRFR